MNSSSSSSRLIGNAGPWGHNVSVNPLCSPYEFETGNARKSAMNRERLLYAPSYRPFSTASDSAVRSISFRSVRSESN